MKFAILSDIHLGDDQCMMVTKKHGRLVPGPKYDAFRETVGTQNDYLILIGDILDLSIAHYEDVYPYAKFFFRRIQSDRIAKEVIYLPGNHDADIWHTVQHQKSVIKRLERGLLPENFDHSVAGIINDRTNANGVNVTSHVKGSTYTMTNVTSNHTVVAMFDKSSSNNNKVFSSVKKDFDGDGKGDLLWYNAKTGDVGIWLMNGVSISQVNLVAQVSLEWQIKAIGDFNGDGKSDIIWQNTTNGDMYMWIIDGGVISGGGFVVKGIPSDWTLRAVADFDGDGKVDALWQNTTNGDVAMWQMNGMTISSGNYVVKGIPGNWQMKAVGDFNGDGKADVLWQETASGDTAIWLMNGMTISSGNYVVKGIPGNW
ncbi:hypothetical protein MBAV_004643, partial [Candidatus Magnetobacterium bavaricum]